MTPLDRVKARAPVLPLASTSAARDNSLAAPSAKGEAGGFASVLRGQMERTGPVRFSAHAQQRLDSRAIAFTPDDQARIAKAVDQAAAKGARESLLLMDDVALVVSVPNRTVITALGKNEAANTVFTNIDSAVVVPGSPASPMNTPTGPDPAWGSPGAADRPMRRLGQEI